MWMKVEDADEQHQRRHRPARRREEHEGGALPQARLLEPDPLAAIPHPTAPARAALSQPPEKSIPSATNRARLGFSGLASPAGAWNSAAITGGGGRGRSPRRRIIERWTAS